ncbi:MAG: hypothetical protein K2R98_26880 [Gemmataceae bacterium]|nr:hypothetical protein [Gemmataceae bacterium]
MSDEEKEKRHHEEHHAHHHHHHHKEHEGHAAPRGLHPAWFIVVGGVFIFLIVITWTFFL